MLLFLLFVVVLLFLVVGCVCVLVPYWSVLRVVGAVVAEFDCGFLTEVKQISRVLSTLDLP